jgi:hypothetical protein
LSELSFNRAGTIAKLKLGYQLFVSQCLGESFIPQNLGSWWAQAMLQVRRFIVILKLIIFAHILKLKEESFKRVLPIISGNGQRFALRWLPFLLVVFCRRVTT